MSYSLPALLEMLREPCGEPDCGHCGLERQAADEIERLQAIVNRLPKDAEGNPVTPECELVATHYQHICQPRRVCEIRAGGWRFYGSSWYEQGDKNRLCYRTREAAEAARKERP